MLFRSGETGLEGKSTALQLSKGHCILLEMGLEMMGCGKASEGNGLGLTGGLGPLGVGAAIEGVGVGVPGALGPAEQAMPSSVPAKARATIAARNAHLPTGLFTSEGWPLAHRQRERALLGASLANPTTGPRRPSTLWTASCAWTGHGIALAGKPSLGGWRWSWRPWCTKSKVPWAW